MILDANVLFLICVIQNDFLIPNEAHNNHNYTTFCDVLYLTTIFTIGQYYNKSYTCDILKSILHNMYNYYSWCTVAWMKIKCQNVENIKTVLTNLTYGNYNYCNCNSTNIYCYDNN